MALSAPEPYAHGQSSRGERRQREDDHKRLLLAEPLAARLGNPERT